MASEGQKEPALWLRVAVTYGCVFRSNCGRLAGRAMALLTASASVVGGDWSTPPVGAVGSKRSALLVHSAAW